MESSLTSFQDESTQTSTVAVETSRCARCVRDRKGCDRLLPCSRCVEADMDDSCVYTGAIQSPKRRHSRRGHGTDVSPMVEPHEKRRRRGRVANGYSKDQAVPRVSLEDATRGEDDWYRDAPDTVADVAEIEPEKTDLEFVRSRIFNSYSDIVTHLPVEIYRSTTFIRALDASYQVKSEALDLLCRNLQHLDSAEQVSTTRSKIHQLMIESDEDRNEAIVEVAKLQTLVASHIAVLTTDLEAAESRSSSMPITMETSSKSILEPSKKAKAGHRKRNSTGTDDGLDIPIDEDEPIYCYCQRVSFGKMIACENEHCEGGEWFHFQCLGWTVAPRGKWWCQVCADAGMGSKNFVRRQEELHRTKPPFGKSSIGAGRAADARTLKRERSLSRLIEKSHRIHTRMQR